jgi:hypothetical protein
VPTGIGNPSTQESFTERRFEIAVGLFGGSKPPLLESARRPLRQLATRLRKEKQLPVAKFNA